MPALSLALLGRGTSANDGTGDTARDGALKLNRNARLLEALAKGAVISATTTAQPASPSVGDLYIIPSGKTGTDWSGMTNGSLALYAENDGANAWFEITPAEGWRMHASDTDVLYRHNGSAWVVLMSSAMAAVVQAASTDAGLGELNGVLQVATKTALKALTGGVVDVVRVQGRASAGDGGGGDFRWTSSDVSASVTVDTAEAIYVPPTGETGSDGAWVRIIEDYAQAAWWGVVPGSVTVATFNEMISTVGALSSAVVGEAIEFDEDFYIFNSKPAAIEAGVQLRGAGSSLTVFQRNYSEAGGDDVGFITLEGDGANGAKLVGIQLRALDGTSGGTMLVEHTDDPAGFHLYEDVVITYAGSGTYVWAFQSDGVGNTTAGSQGMRDTRFQDCFFFKGNGASGGAKINNAVNMRGSFWTNGNITITGGGASDSNSNTMNLHVQCLATLTVEKATSVVISGSVQSLTFESTATNCAFIGVVTGGSFTNSSTSCAVIAATGGVSIPGNLTSGGQVSGASLAIAGTNILARVNEWTAANVFKFNSARVDVYVPTGSGGTGVPSVRLRTDSRYDELTYNASGMQAVLNTTGTPVTFLFGTDGKFDAPSGFEVAGTQVVGARGSAVADASGGSTVDAEARTAVNTLLARLRTHGLIAT